MQGEDLAALVVTAPDPGSWVVLRPTNRYTRVCHRTARRLLEPVACFNHGQYIFSRPSDAALPGRHGFVKVDSLLLRIKMMQRLLRPESEN